MCFQWYQYAYSDTGREGLCGRGEKNGRDRGRDRAGEEGGQQTDAQEGESERNIDIGVSACMYILCYLLFNWWRNTA